VNGTRLKHSLKDVLTQTGRKSFWSFDHATPLNYITSNNSNNILLNQQPQMKSINPSFCGVDLCCYEEMNQLLKADKSINS